MAASQAVRLPVKYRFKTSEVLIRRDPDTGEVVLSEKPSDWSGLFALLESKPVPRDFLWRKEHSPKRHRRDPFRDMRS